MDDQKRELKERMSRMSDDELLNMVEVDFADYRQDALDVARAELLSRGISLDEETDEEAAELAEGSGSDLSEYSYEAIQRARIMLAQRDRELARAEHAILQKQGTADSEDQEPEEIVERDTSHAQEREVRCASCDAVCRYGILQAESSLSLTFPDNSEQRFVDAYACPNCGRIQLMMDLEG
jgi:hypothetical protein